VVVIVGGGLAGLVAAWRLQQKGLKATVYEASTRTGGRVDTDTTTFAEGQRVERGGELIDTGHHAYRKLIKDLGLGLDNLIKAEPAGSEPFHWFDGEPYVLEQVEDDFAAVFKPLKADVKAAGYPTTYDHFTAAGAALDQMSILDWIAARVPGGLASRFGQLLDVAYNIEYGAECGVQSSLNLLYLLGFGSTPQQFSMFGDSDEVFRVQGGNGQVPERLAQQLGSAIRLEQRLVAASTLADGRTRLTFEGPGGLRDVVADRAIMAVPFSILRAKVDISGLALKPLKRTAIEQQGMGTNSKLHVQFASRPWVALGCNGETFADLGYQNTWEETRKQPGASGILVNYTGGTLGASFGSGTPASHAQTMLAQIEPLLPGLSARWNGLATVDFWTGSPFQLGSYSYWKVGQYVQFAGVEREVEGTLHFAGEHTSVDAQGYMEGAVESGERAAAEVLAAVG
ncbi:flavin monoamine oxidase family protein, partial [Escherichia coli]|uniref:flavin monoamine oxidase family protein n=5 Tax=Enterobacteriaceae TaxID=543 RepID=UPI00092C4130